MLAIEVCFLTGRYVATAHNDRSEAEWPPHPARLYSALVATWADEDVPSDEERRALRLIEALGDPQICASEAAVRTPVISYVPINDSSVIRTHVDRADRIATAVALLPDAAPKQVDKLTREIAKLRDIASYVSVDPKANPASVGEMFPDHRPKQARQFPSVTPSSSTVSYVWPNADLEESDRLVLDGLLSRVIRLGHSSSLVSCRLIETTSDPTFVPDSDGELLLRSVREGQLEALERSFEQHGGSKPRTMPASGIRYRAVDVDPAIQRVEPLWPSTAGDWIGIEFAAADRRRPARVGVSVAQALRGAVLHHAADSRIEVLGGHAENGRPSTRSHVAFVPIPFVGRHHATGSMLGAAIVLPNGLAVDDPERRAIYSAIAKLPVSFELRLGRGGVIACNIAESSTLDSLSSRPWAAAPNGETRWISATPVALPQHPGSLRAGSANKQAKAWERVEELVVQACIHVGLPAPRSVHASIAPLLVGSTPASKYPAFLQRDWTAGRDAARALVHVDVEFETPVAGPFLLGSGRFFGLGLMRPVGGSQ
jgi:CRISPR-associated protein Csb2